MSLKDDLYKHLLELGYEEHIGSRWDSPKAGQGDGYLVVGKKYVSFEQGIDTLIVYSTHMNSHLGRPVVVYNIHTGAYNLTLGPGTIGFWSGSPLGKLDLQIRKFLQPVSISFIQSLEEED